MQIATWIVAGVVLCLATTPAGAQQRAGLIVGVHQVSEVVRTSDSVVELSPDVEPSPAGRTSASVGLLAGPRPVSIYAPRADGNGPFKSGPGRALADGAVVGFFVFSVTHFVDSESAVKAGLVGGAVVLVGELLWQQLRPDSDGK